MLSRKFTLEYLDIGENMINGIIMFVKIIHSNKHNISDKCEGGFHPGF